MKKVCGIVKASKNERMRQMEKNREELKKMVYDLMNGSLELDLCTAPEKELVVYEYADGGKCKQLYDEVFAANRRICQRLGVEEDGDVEIIIRNLLNIGEHLSMKMYDYGEYFSQKDMQVEDNGK